MVRARLLHTISDNESIGTEWNMASATARQGRPKGSGLDDSQQLARIAALLAADPKLKPTTAIRSLGIEDPSLIRRLRNKYRAEQAVLQTNAHQL